MKKGDRRLNYRRITPEKKRELLKLAAQGATYKEIATRLELGETNVRLTVTPLGGVIRKELWTTSPSRLSLDDRVEIRIGLEKGMSLRAIGRGLGRHASTICREVNANGGPASYAPMAAHRRAAETARRPKITKLAANPRLCEGWSPISGSCGLLSRSAAVLKRNSATMPP